ncbi:M20/M25/M40 family metallo-hydrolase [Leucobacter sp. UT-8R-CII-1-4]|uniref:M20/M25/M40 family metallo-hydrolase n=1 Tax=Leucobacter sp. UT-8R-CII-1-4 TaxID=3040075 RepID=UPI0024A8C77E|nr:M20/M25/M40 family metallo-hydrolase [Leucobacter sp. UT-8R-CII-1-4]MDI6023649.1 M20/M25/M40 family metallo-hydrolase [Leucobacter sp. UT-8R-CII-1-4]
MPSNAAIEHRSDSATDDLLSDTVELLQELVRAACVNDGTEASGHEVRGVRVLLRFFDEEIESGRLDAQVLESAPGRASLIVRLRGSDSDDPSVPALGLLGHLDVVPASPERWQRDPFGGELVDGEIWGRGTVDMLYLTAVFAAVLREAARSGQLLRGDLVLLAVADEEAGGEYGLKWLLREHPEVVRVSEALSETGGMRLGAHVAIDVAEKGSAGRRLVVRGIPGHASIPFGAESAAVRAGVVLQRLAQVEPGIELGELWRPFVAARIADASLAERLLDPVRVDGALAELGGIAGYAHAISRVTIAPTVLRAGSSHNVIPDEAHIDLDIRTLPGTSDTQVDALLREMLADQAEQVEIQHLKGWPATASPAEHPLFAAVCRSITETDGSPVVPVMAAGGSDARLFRMAGVPAFGFGLLSAEWSYERYRERIHAHNERIDVASVELTLRAARSVVAQRLS